jgi:demethylmenaquinone methyltransferase/2-methoxy-6-polyprenyl-1,4-benzoquinol methylase
MVCVLADASHLPFRRVFTKAILVDSLHHFGNQEEALSEVGRVMVKGGVLYIDDLDPSRSPTRIIRLVELLFLERSRFLLPDTLRKILESRRFSSISLAFEGPTFMLRAERQ